MIIFGKKIFIISLVFALIVIFLAVFLIPSLINSLRRESDSFIAIKKTISLLDKEIEEFERFQDKQSFYYSKLSAIEGSFVDPEVPIAFLEFLEDKAALLDLSVEISPISMGGKDEGSWDSLGFQVLVTGPSPRCLRYLEEVQMSKWILEIRDLEIQRIPEKDFSGSGLESFSPGDVYMAFSLKVYSQSKMLTKD